MNAEDINQIKVESKEPGLFIISTPIGNMGDITIRALRILKTADLVLCEDTRQTRKLLNYYGISAKTDSYNDHTTEKKRESIIELLKSGMMVALVSDAGTPLVSDPGYKLVRAAVDSGIKIIPIPGPSSILAALVKSAMPSDSFMFCGFVESKKFKKQQDADATLIYFESAKRLVATLEKMAAAFPNRSVCVIRELTKIYEEVKSGSFAEVTKYYSEHPPRGEIVILLSPPEKMEANEADIEKALKIALKTAKLKDASEELAKKFNVSKKHIYEIGLKIKQ